MEVLSTLFSRTLTVEKFLNIFKSITGVYLLNFFRLLSACKHVVYFHEYLSTFRDIFYSKKVSVNVFSINFLKRQTVTDVLLCFKFPNTNDFIKIMNLYLFKVLFIVNFTT